MLGTALAAKAPADGYNVLVGDSGPLSIAPGLQKDLAFNPDKDFIPVCRVANGATVLVVNNDTPFRSVADLMEAGAHVVSKGQGMDGVSDMIHDVQVEATFPDGTKLVTVHHPIRG